MLRRFARPLITRGVLLVARHPGIHLLVKRAYPLVPGLRPFLRRFLPGPTPVAAPTLAEIEAMLVFDRSRTTQAPGRVVTVEQLCLLARTA